MPEKYTDELTLANELLEKTNALVAILLENHRGVHFNAYPGAFNTKVEDMAKVLDVIFSKYGAK